MTIGAPLSVFPSWLCLRRSGYGLFHQVLWLLVGNIGSSVTTDHGGHCCFGIYLILLVIYSDVTFSI